MASPATNNLSALLYADDIRVSVILLCTMADPQGNPAIPPFGLSIGVGPAAGKEFCMG